MMVLIFISMNHSSSLHLGVTSIRLELQHRLSIIHTPTSPHDCCHLPILLLELGMREWGVQNGE